MLKNNKLQRRFLVQLIQGHGINKHIYQYIEI